MEENKKENSTVSAMEIDNSPHGVEEMAQETHYSRPFPFRSIIIMAIAAVLSIGLYAILPFEPNPSKGLALYYLLPLCG